VSLPGRCPIANAFATASPDQAPRIADETVDFAIASFDGAFLAFQADPATSHEHLMRQMAFALCSIGKKALGA
jgi:hypothetical protein